MKRFDWNPLKNQWLQKVRGISFDDVLFHLQSGGLLDVRHHPRSDRYPGQRVFVILIGGYVYLVPFVETDEVIFLKTVIPSRKETRAYLKDGNP